MLVELFSSICDLAKILKIDRSKFRKNILEILKTEGYIKDYFIEKNENNKIYLKINLKYYEGYPVIKEIKIKIIINYIIEKKYI